MLKRVSLRSPGDGQRGPTVLVAAVAVNGHIATEGGFGF